MRWRRCGNQLVRFAVLTGFAVVAFGVATADAQPATRPAAAEEVEKPEPQAIGDDLSKLAAQGIEHIFSKQEGDNSAEWPYEGVYRVKGAIPIGYRIGGTAICAMAIVQAPGYAESQAHHQAIERAVNFIVEGAAHPLMSPDYDSGYDVRGWGYTYGLTFLLRLKSLDAVPKEMGDAVESTIKFFIDAIERTEISKVGGWNYARAQGRDAVSPPSPFMTGPTLQALFAAKSAGYAVNQEVVKRALDALEQGRTPSGSFRYSGVNGDKSRESIPGSIGRMAVSETTLFLAGRSSVANIRSAIDAFIVHWEWLDKRRAQQGTHAPPYGIAPYYFYYAHYYAAQAVELLPEHERPEYRRRIRELLMSVRLPDATWNDRVFERSSCYGTAMSVMALMMPQTARPAEWKE